MQAPPVPSRRHFAALVPSGGLGRWKRGEGVAVRVRIWSAESYRRRMAHPRCRVCMCRRTQRKQLSSSLVCFDCTWLVGCDDARRRALGLRGKCRLGNAMVPEWSEHLILC